MRVKLFTLLLMALMGTTGLHAQTSPDFAQKFMTLCKKDSTVNCITISPKMMEQLVKQQADGRPENITQAIAKLKSARIVNTTAEHYQKAEGLLLKNKQRFQVVKNFETDEAYGAFYSRKNKEGNTVELVMLRVDTVQNTLTIVNLTGDIDEEFLCFLYNNKSFKN